MGVGKKDVGKQGTGGKPKNQVTANPTRRLQKPKFRFHRNIIEINYH